jgi:predicted CopG family antitoxin
MTTTTISLERSAYELLRARKRPDESFSEELHRLLGSAGPDLKDFLEIVSLDDGRTIADAIGSIRAEDLAEEKTKAGRARKEHGRRA